MKKRKVVGVEHPIVQKKIENSLKLSIKEGALSSVSMGFGASYFSPFALAMNATSSQVGILHAVVSLFPALVQMKAPKLIEKFSRKKILLWGIMLQILLLAPVILVGYLFYIGVPHMIWALIALVGIFYGLRAVDHPAWFSWMGSLIPEEKRGKYFSKRNRAAGFAGIVTMIVAALILDGMKSYGIPGGDVLGYTLLGFGILFVLSGTTRIWSWILLARQYEPKLKVRKKDDFSFWQFLKRAPSTPFGKFAIFRGAFSITVGVAGPFWAVYLLRDLGFSYIWYIAITVSAVAFQLMSLPFAGKISDKFGNIRLMKICSAGIFLVPASWLLSSFIPSDIIVKIYLLIVPAMLGGFVWAGYNLAVNNYVYDAVWPRKQGFCASYMNLLVGVGTFIGAAIGSLIVWVGVPFMNTILFIFLLSMGGRILVPLLGSRYLKEVRRVEKYPTHYMIEEYRPMQGVVTEIHNLEHLVSKVEHYIETEVKK